MSENKRKNPFSIYWIYAILGVALIAAEIYWNSGSRATINKKSTLMELIDQQGVKNVKIVNIHPFASDFYYVTRLIYAIYAKFSLKKKPSFNHPLQKVALNISMNNKLSTTRYSQVQKYIFKKK